jgi:hypothetical protein
MHCKVRFPKIRPNDPAKPITPHYTLHRSLPVESSVTLVTNPGKLPFSQGEQVLRVVDDTTMTLRGGLPLTPNFGPNPKLTRLFISVEEECAIGNVIICMWCWWPGARDWVVSLRCKPNRVVWYAIYFLLLRLDRIGGWAIDLDHDQLSAA